MSIDDVVNVSITAASANPTVQGFGTPLLLAYHSVIPDLLKQYSSPADLLADGFHTYDPAYRMATAVCSQNPRPPHFYLGKRQTAYNQIFDLGPLNTTTGYVYAFTVVDHLGVATNISYTVTPGETIAQICTAIAALLAGVAGCTVTATATKVHFVSTAGYLTNVKNLPPPTVLTVADTTADPGIIADLAAIEAIDALGWYGIMVDSNSKAEILALAAHVESQTKVYVPSNSDTEITNNASTTDVAYAVKAAAYARTAVLYSASELLSYSGAAWLGGMLPTNPGGGNWAFRTLAGITVDTIAGLAANALTKNCNVYTPIAGINCTQYGRTGSGQFIDITIFMDWLRVTMQARIFQALANASATGKKIPFTDAGGNVIRGIIASCLDDAIDPNISGGLAATPAPTVYVPPVATVSSLDRGNRNLPGCSFTGQLSGALNSLKIAGTIAV